MYAMRLTSPSRRWDSQIEELITVQKRVWGRLIILMIFPDRHYTHNAVEAKAAQEKTDQIRAARILHPPVYPERSRRTPQNDTRRNVILSGTEWSEESLR